MHVIDHSLSAELQQETNGYQLWVVEMINVGVLRTGQSIHVPYGPSEPLKAACCTRYGLDGDTGPGFVRIPSETQFRRNNDDIVSGADECLTVLMKDAGIEWAVNRCQLYNLDRPLGANCSVQIGAFTTSEMVNFFLLLLRKYCQWRVPK